MSSPGILTASGHAGAYEHGPALPRSRRQGRGPYYTASKQLACRSVREYASPVSTSQPTSERILEVALELFSEHGFDGSSLQQIADRLGVTKAALYYHYRSKDDILRALVAPAIAGLDALLASYAELPNTPANRRRFLAQYIEYLISHRRLIGYIASDIAIVAHPALAPGSDERSAGVRARLAGDDLSFEEEIRTALALRGIPRVIAQYPDADPERLREALLAAATMLLRPGSRR